VLTKWREPYGRPPQITTERVARIIGGVREGMSFTGAAKRAGVYNQLAFYWRTTGTKLDLRDDVDPSRLTEAEKLYILLARGVTLAQGEYEWEQTRKLHQEAEGDWKARAWILERRFPEVWGRKVQLRVDWFPQAAQLDGGEAVDEPTTAERVRVLMELAHQLGIQEPEPKEPAAVQPHAPCKQGLAGHTPGPDLRCTVCGEQLWEQPAARPLASYEPPAEECEHLYGMQHDRHRCANPRCGAYLSRPLPLWGASQRAE
jgi:transposase